MLIRAPGAVNFRLCVSRRRVEADVRKYMVHQGGRSFPWEQQKHREYISNVLNNNNNNNNPQIHKRGSQQVGRPLFSCRVCFVSS